MALSVGLMACGETPVDTGGMSPLVLMARLPAADVSAAASAQGVVPFNRVRLTIFRITGATAADATVPASASDDSTVITLSVPLVINAPVIGEPMTIVVSCIDADGKTVYRGGPVPILLHSGASNPPVVVPLQFVGDSPLATILHIVPHTLSILAGQPFAFTATVLDAAGNTITDAPVLWSVLDPLLATLTSSAGGIGAALGVAGTARIVARVPNGPADTASLVIQPLNDATRLLQLVSGGGQSGLLGALLASPIVVKLVDQAGAAVSGIAVTFAPSPGGIVGTPAATTDSSGIARTTWTLASLVGPQTLNVTAAGLTGTPLVVPATALPVSAVAKVLAVATTIADGVAGTALASVAVRALDDAGSLVTSFASPITMALGANPGGASLLGTRTVTPVGGVATFRDLSIEKAASGYTLAATASGVTSATSNSFGILHAAAAVLAITGGNNQSGLIGLLLGNPLAVKVTDAFGNVVAGVPVAWSVLSGGGLLGSATTQTNASGIATNTWSLGLPLGLQTASAVVNGLSGSPALFEATGLLGSLRSDR